MAETRGEQVTFEWAEQGGEAGASGNEPPGVQEPARQPKVRRARKAPGAATASPQGVTRAKVARGPAKQPVAAAGPPAPPAALPPDDELWDVHAAARFLKRSASWVYHKAEDGSLPVRRLGGWGLRFIPGELRAWVESGGVAPVSRRE